jgi:hypothetical protein
MIAPITRDVADYLRSFDLAVVFITPAGRIGTARGLSPPGRISAAWWTQGRAAAESVLVAIGEHHPGTLEGATRAVLQAAARLGVVLARARAAIGKLDGKLAAAQQLGDLRFFNRAYKRYRLDCLRRGGRPMPYGTAVAKLRKALAGAAAGAPITSLLSRILSIGQQMRRGCGVSFHQQRT